MKTRMGLFITVGTCWTAAILIAFGLASSPFLAFGIIAAFAVGALLLN